MTRHLILILALAVPTAAAAQTRPAPDLAAAVFAPRHADAPAERIRGVAKTAVDRRYDRDVTGSLGFLCGLQESADRKGGAAARGVDPTGRFVGAKLSIAFR
jgi:hypothetical protein